MRRACVIALCLSLGLAPAEGAAQSEGPRFGVNDNSVGIGVAPPATVMQRLAEIRPPHGAVYRFTVDWRNVEPVDDTWEWARYDAIYESAVAHGLRPLPILLNSPAWAKGAAGACGEHSGVCISPPDRTPEALAEWGEFAAHATRRWPRAEAIEVWNEPNIPSFWTTAAGPDPAYFNDVLCTAYEAIKLVAPERTVLLGGLANPETSARDRRISQTDFLRPLYQQGGAQGCSDAIAVHPYPLQHRPDGPGSRFLQDMDRVRAELARNGDAGRPLWITEFGYFTGLPQPLAPPERRPVTEDEQARWLTCAYRLAAGMPDVEAFFVHTLFDPGIHPTYAEHHFGLNRHPHVPLASRKPAHTAFVELFRRHPLGVPPAGHCG